MARRKIGWGVPAVALAAFACLTPAPAPLPDDLLEELSGRAEAARRLEFRAPVAAWEVEPGAVGRLLRDELAVGWSDAEVRRAEALGVAAGLLPAGTDLRRALLAFQTEAVAGFYTPIRDALYVVATPGRTTPGPEERAVIVHELVHVLQAQHTALLDVTLGIDDQDDLVFAVGALLEGDALYASFEDQASHESIARTPASAFAASFEVEWAAAPPSPVPRIIREAFLVQYPTGYALAEALIEPGGMAALDAAERDPPLSSEMLLHPERYLDPTLRKPLSLPRLAPGAFGPGCTAIAANTYGELGLRVWGVEGGRPRARAEAAADGWDGDRALLLDCPTGRAFAWVVDFDAPVDAAEFEREAQSVAAVPGPDGADAGPGRWHVERRTARVLLSRSLGAEGRETAFAAPTDRYDDLDAYLRAHPEVRVRAEERRARARR